MRPTNQVPFGVLEKVIPPFTIQAQFFFININFKVIIFSLIMGYVVVRYGMPVGGTTTTTVESFCFHKTSQISHYYCARLRAQSFSLLLSACIVKSEGTRMVIIGAVIIGNNR